MRPWAIALSILLIAIVVVLVIVFIGDDTGGTTTTEPGASTTSAVQVTTTTGENTTTSEMTTTTAATTTALASGLEGNWAEEPLVVSALGSLGWWDGDGWVRAGETRLPIAGGEDYQIALYGVEAITTGRLEDQFVILEDEGLLGELPGPVGVAISAPWVLTPYLVEEIVDDGTYSAVAAGLLAERGLTVSNPLIKQVFRFDLEGDGVNEVLVVAEDVPDDLLNEAKVGDYSIVFQQKVVDGIIQTAVVRDSVAHELTTGEVFIESLTVATIADLSGDGRMEFVLDYQPSQAVVVFEYVNDDVGAVSQIAVGEG